MSAQFGSLVIPEIPLEGIQLIEASAGTGKTWSICGIYLRLVLERGLGVEQILVVTFTKAATAELRARLRARLLEARAIAAGEVPAGTDPFIDGLLAQARHCARDDAALIARIDLALQSFDDAAVFTIHGFCQRALGDVPLAAGVPLALEMVQDDGPLRHEVVADFWRREVAGGILSRGLAARLVEAKDEPAAWSRLLKLRMAKPLTTMAWPPGTDGGDGVSPDLDGVERAYRSLCGVWAEGCTEALELLEANRANLNAGTYKADAIKTAASQCRDLVAWGDPFAPVGDKVRLLSTDTMEERKKKACTPPRHAVFDAIGDFIARRDSCASLLSLQRLALMRRMLETVPQQVRELRSARHTLSFDDMLFNLHARLIDSRFPGLAESLRARFPVALIDEFQDTDPLQWGIFSTIYGTGVGSLFLVGDPKQAIYRFRNADLDTYLRARQQISAGHTLTANQRACDSLREALNTLFSANPSAFLLPGLAYPLATKGQKPISPFVDEGSTEGSLQVWMLPGEAAGCLAKAEASQRVTEATAARIARLLADAAEGKVRIGDEALRPGQIAVLVRSHAQAGEVKRALQALAIGSVELAQDSVYASDDADELLRILHAIAAPRNSGVVRSALATQCLGRDAGAIANLADGAGLDQEAARFEECRLLWRGKGFGAMFRKLLTLWGVTARLLTRPDGERRLTNLLQLGELLHAAARIYPAPEALLRFFQVQCQGGDQGSQSDEAQLRLESDQNLVQIVTVHKSKGLEYPVTFCPFLWDGRIRSSNDGEWLEYHDEAGESVLDFTVSTLDDNALKALKDKARREAAGEDLRLFYVALTRAVYRCYLVAGTYAAKPNGKASDDGTYSMLNWLACGTGSPESWLAKAAERPDIEAGWAALAAPGSLHVEPLPDGLGVPLVATPLDPAFLVSLPAPKIPEGWRMGSYSSLRHGRSTEHSAADRDRAVSAGTRSAHGTSGTTSDVTVAAGDILRFPRGAEAGECIHSVFEVADFADTSTWSAAIDRALQLHPPVQARGSDGSAAACWPDMLHTMLADVVATEILPGLRLSAVRRRRRLNELEFVLPCPNARESALESVLQEAGLDGPPLAFGALSGFLRGFIDLVFEHAGRYYVLDWKSNHLGNEPAAYGQEPVGAAMASQGYHLQHVVYGLALHRHLTRRLPDYSHERHFGGVIYLFVRGVRPGWRDALGAATGVFHLHTPLSLLEQAAKALGMKEDPAAAAEEGVPC